MRRGLISFLTILLILTSVSALCGEGQVDINIASLEELDLIIGVGPATAQKIIDNRPFDSLDDLKRVSGLGGTGAKVENIKSQGLACVDKESSKKSDDEEKKIENEEIEEEDKIKNTKAETEEYFNEDKNITRKQIPIQKEIISISQETKDIKIEENKESSGEKNYSFIGLVLFCFLLGGLYLIKEKRKYKNEFKK